MSFQTATSSHHIKLLALALLLVSIWFFFTATSPRLHHVPKMNFPVTGIVDYYYGKTGSAELLPLPEAKEYCAARRWEPYPNRDHRRKVYDLLLVNTELEWLEIRMGQMNDQVDYFVIAEAPRTFTDAEKPLYVRDNWSRFSKYHHKMILHTVNMDGGNFQSPWDRETFSRNAMFDQVLPTLTGDREAHEGDVILVSDVDEIPRPDAIKALRNCAFPRETTLHTKMYYYGFQWLKREDWAHPQATFYEKEKTILPNDLRSSHGADLWNAGWHCSYCFSTVAEMVTKITSFSHSELNRDEFKDPDKIVGRVRGGRDMFDREGADFDRVEDNPDVPQFLVNNRKYYSYLLNRDPSNANFKDYRPKR